MAVTTPTSIEFAATGDFVTTELDGDITAAATTATIGTGLNIPATNGILQLDYDSTLAVGADSSPETVKYATYTTGTGALTGLTRGADANTTGVAHSDGALVQAGASTLHFNNITDIIENKAWQTWTPTWTNLTIGAAAVSAKYLRIGKIVLFRLNMTWAGDTSASGLITFSLPVTGLVSGVGIYSTAICNDSDTTLYNGVLGMPNTTTATVHAMAAGGTYVVHTDTSATVPFVWATGDKIFAQGIYEAA